MERYFPGKLPILHRNVFSSVSLTKSQVACLLANAILCTFPPPGVNERTKSCTGINFTYLYVAEPATAIKQKWLCIMNYFNRVHHQQDSLRFITFRRVSLGRPPLLIGSAVELSATVVLHTGRSSHQVGDGALSVTTARHASDIRCSIFGSGRDAGEVQYFDFPELISALLFFEAIRVDEAIFIGGCRRYSASAETGRSLPWIEDGFDVIFPTPYEVLSTFVVVRDVGQLTQEEFHTQFLPRSIHRDFHHIYAGLYSSPMVGSATPPLCSGSHTFPRSQQSSHLRFLLLLMACYYSRRDLHCCVDKLGARDHRELLGVLSYLRHHKITAGR